MRKIALVGTAASRVLTPYDDPSWEVWGINGFWARPWMYRCDLGFEIHPLTTLPPGDLRILRESEMPVYMRRRYPAIPTSRRYPIEAVTRGLHDVFTSSFSYEVALAVYWKVDEIGLFGIGFDMPGATAREQTMEWLGLAYWLGVAAGRGIKLTLPDESRLLGPMPRYGLNYWPEVRTVRARLDRLRKLLRRKQYDGIHGDARASVLRAQLNGGRR